MYVPANPARKAIDTIRAQALQLSLWLLDLVACVAAATGSRTLRLWVRDETRYARRWARQTLFLFAFAHCDPPRLRNRTCRPAHARHGFRRQRLRCGLVRHAVRGVALDSLAAIRRAMANAEALGARLARRIRWRAVHWGWVAVAPPAVRCAAQIEAWAGVCPDTS